MTRTEFIQAFAAVRNGAPTISGPGTISRILWQTSHQDATIYQMDMGYAAATSLGLALARPDLRVVALEGDGSIIAALSVLTTISRYQPPNFALVIVDNGTFASAGDGSTTTNSRHGTDIAAVARACGIAASHAVTVDTREAADEILRSALNEAGPWVVVAKVDDSDLHLMRNRRGVIPFDITETSISFRRALTRGPQ